MKYSTLSFQKRMKQRRGAFKVSLLKTKEFSYETAFVDILVDGRSFQSILGIEGAGLVTDSLDYFGGTSGDTTLLKVLSDQLPQPDLSSDINPIYICGECGGYDCGVFGWQVDITDQEVTWRNFRWDDNLGIDDEDEYGKDQDEYAGWKFTFEKKQYFQTLKELEELENKKSPQ